MIDATSLSWAPPLRLPSLSTTLLLLPPLLLLLYLIILNHLLSITPPEVKRMVPNRWTAPLLRKTYTYLKDNPITTASYAAQLPPHLPRRYIITGGSGLVGGFLVLQLLERGHPPSAIRIIDFQPPHRADMLSGPAARVGFVRADIASEKSTRAAFDAPWEKDVARLPLTVFHTAAVIVPSARSEYVKGFCEAVNVRGTQHVVDAARAAGADVLVATTSASIAIRPVEFWGDWWRRWGFPRHYWQVLDESDFWKPLRPHREFFANYPASKAKAERIVCGANSEGMRTGCIRPGNGIYGHPTDNLLGAPLNMQTYYQWVQHTVQSFSHGINCAVAHLEFESVLASGPETHTRPQAGRPFVITDPGPPLYYGDMYLLIRTLATTPFRLVTFPPVPMLLVAYAIEFYNLVPYRWPRLAAWLHLPRIPGDARHLEPGLFSICTHLVARTDDACRSVSEGGLGYRGVLSTLEGMCMEVVEWNAEQEEYKRVHGAHGNGATKGNGILSGKGKAKYFRNSVALAEDLMCVGGGDGVAL